jgi:hypothetical protein
MLLPVTEKINTKSWIAKLLRTLNELQYLQGIALHRCSIYFMEDKVRFTDVTDIV